MTEHSTRKVAYNTVVQIIGRIIGLAVALVTLSYVSNHLVVNGSALAGYGQYTIVFTYISILGSIADFGLFTLLVREITGKDATESGRLIGSAIMFRFIVMLLALLIILLLINFLPYAEVVKHGIIIGVFIAFSMLFWQAVAAIFQAEQQASKIVIVETTGRVAIALATIAELNLGYGLIPIILVNFIGQLIILVLGLVLARKFTRIRIHLDLQLWKDMSPQFWTIALIDVLALIHFKSDTLLLTLFKSESDVGIYGIAYKILEVVLIIPAIFATNLLPVFSGLFNKEDHKGLTAEIKRSNSVLFVVASYLIATLIVLAPWLINFVTQQAFLSATLPLRILAVSLFFSFFTTLLSQAVIAARHQARLVKGYILVVVINIVLNLLIIPRYSYTGAAITTLITEAILAGYTLLISGNKFGSIINWSQLGRIIPAGVLTLFCLGYLSYIWPAADTLNRQGLLVVIVEGALAGAVVYGVIIFVLFGGSTTKLKKITELS